MIEHMFDTTEQSTRTGNPSVVGELDALALGENAVRAALLSRVAVLERTEEWKSHGAATLSQWLTARYGHSHATATELVRVAKASADLPETMEVFQEGGLSWDQLRAVTRIATADDDGVWAKAAPGLSVTELNAFRRAPTSRQVRDLSRDRHLVWSFSNDEPAFDLRTHLLDSDGATVINALMRIANQAGPDPVDGTYENIEARLADALVQMASQSLGADSDPDRATVVIHTDLETLTDPTAPGARPARIKDGPALSARTLHRLACDARLQVVVTGQAQGPVGVGRTTRTIAPWLRRAVESRDNGCRFHGCERTRWTHVHHIVHWAQGGPTDLENLILLCGFHHRLVHEAGWRISGDPGRDIVWIRPNGQPVTHKRTPAQIHSWRRILAGQPPIIPPRLDPNRPEYLDTS